MKWIVSVANFSGVEVWGFTVMDNHLHLIVHVPPVPKEYWLDANDEPAAYAFGMRPPECRVPLWNGDSPSLGSLRIGDSPSPGSVASSAAVGPKETRTSGDGDSPRRPPVGFMLDDAEMLARLRYLYSGKRVDDIAGSGRACEGTGSATSLTSASGVTVGACTTSPSTSRR